MKEHRAMRAQGWFGRALFCLPLIGVAAGLSGCKTLSERYIALEVWKYERCFGHLPPGFVPPGAPAGAQAGPPGRICGEGGGCQQSMDCCDPCQGGGMAGGMMMDGRVDGVRIPAGAQVPLGPGGSPGPMGVTSGRPIVISDEVVMP